MFFKYWKESEVQGINTLRFVVPKEYFQSPLINKDNECYCIENDLKDCDRNGLLEISRCWRRTYGAPIVMSEPYYNHGDEYLRTQFKTQLNHKTVDDDNYGTYIDVEPVYYFAIIINYIQLTQIYFR